MEAINKVIQDVLAGWSKEKGGPAGSGPEGVLKKILTKQEQGHIKFNYSKGGVISVNVDSSSWMYSLNLKKESLLAALEKESAGIKDIHFRIGEIK